MKLKGRKSIINQELVEKINILKNKELTIKQIALETNVSRSTIYKVLKLHLGYKSDFSLKKGNHYDEFSENK